MLKIRLTRIGAKKKPFYRVVVMDERAKRNGAYIELLGTYNPLTEPKDIKLKQERIDYWIKQGAKLSSGFLRIIGKAPQRPPRKPKKEKKDTGNSEQVKTEEPAKEEKTAATEEATPEQPVKEGQPEEVRAEETPVEAAPTEEKTESTEPETNEPTPSIEPATTEESEKTNERPA